MTEFENQESNINILKDIDTYNESIRSTDSVESMIESLKMMIHRLVENPVDIQVNIFCNIIIILKSNRKFTKSMQI